MKEIKQLCSYSHDYDGFMYVEENCICTLCKKGRKYVLKQMLNEDRDYEPAGGKRDEILLEGDNLNKTLEDFCISHWAKVYGIRKNDAVTMKEHINSAQV